MKREGHIFDRAHADAGRDIDALLAAGTLSRNERTAERAGPSWASPRGSVRAVALLPFLWREF